MVQKFIQIVRIKKFSRVLSLNDKSVFYGL